MVVDEGIPIRGVIGADAGQHGHGAGARAGVRPSLAGAPGSSRVADAAYIACGSPRLEEDRAARREAVGVERRVPAIDLDAIDEPERNERQVCGAADVVVEPDASKVHGHVLGRGSADRGGSRRAVPSGLGHRDARLRAKDVLRLETRFDEAIASHDRARHGGVPGPDGIAQRIAADEDFGSRCLVERGPATAAPEGDAREGRLSARARPATQVDAHATSHATRIDAAARLGARFLEDWYDSAST